MGQCVFCGEGAGIFRTAHRNCKARFSEAKKRIVDLVVRGLREPQRFTNIRDDITNLSNTHQFAEHALRQALVEGWEAAVEHAFDDGLISENEENILAQLRSQFGLQQDDLDRNGAYSRVVKGGLLRDVMAGRPTRVVIDGFLPFNLQKTEYLVWVFQDVEYYEDQIEREYVGGHYGVSIRVAKGLYVRTGSFRGRPVDRTVTTHVDTGILGVTTRHIYFAGASKSFRIRHDKIVAYQPYSDGIGLHRDARTAKPQTFVTGDGWFTYNLLTNVNRS